jgi:hypothetical protein
MFLHVSSDSVAGCHTLNHTIDRSATRGPKKELSACDLFPLRDTRGWFILPSSTHHHPQPGGNTVEIPIHHNYEPSCRRCDKNAACTIRPHQEPEHLFFCSLWSNAAFRIAQQKLDAALAEESKIYVEIRDQIEHGIGDTPVHELEERLRLVGIDAKAAQAEYDRIAPPREIF